VRASFAEGRRHRAIHDPSPDADSPATYPSGTALPSGIRMSVACRVTPAFEKIARGYVRAVCSGA